MRRHRRRAAAAGRALLAAARETAETGLGLTVHALVGGLRALRRVLD